ncbi:MAG TPA: electron transport complex subunit RsxC [Steroidobacteraceae bacterium]|nr:electron transport complex subunit RsxC [Steroidobacteraceae bacterium]
MTTRNEFPSGLVLDAHKQPVAAEPILDVAPPARLRFALDQGSGVVLEPAVAVGDVVAIGSVIARPSDDFGAVLHASASGRVIAIESHDATNDDGGPCIVVENDGRDTPDPALPRGPIDYTALDPATLVDRLREAGIAGLGGAGFPTATKLATARARSARRLLLNGAECEPWICCDDALMRAEADDVVLGGRVLMRALEAESCVIAIEDDKPAAIDALRAAAQSAADTITVEIVPAVYPQGAERQLVTAVFGVEVPARGLPADVGVTCQNVATAAAVARWARSGVPLVTRVVTVTGSGVSRPLNVRARFGTPLATLVEAAGGYRGEPLRLIAGGNMTGRALATDEVGLTKSINTLFVATHQDLAARLAAVEVACIRCGNCADVCPAGLLPQEIHRTALARDADGAVRFGVWDCIDCGCCDYVCPSQIPLALRFREAREWLRERDRAAARAAVARTRHERRERRLQEAVAAEQRAFDVARQQARGESAPTDPGTAT